MLYMRYKIIHFLLILSWFLWQGCVSNVWCQCSFFHAPRKMYSRWPWPKKTKLFPLEKKPIPNWWIAHCGIHLSRALQQFCDLDLIIKPPIQKKTSNQNYHRKCPPQICHWLTINKPCWRINTCRPHTHKTYFVLALQQLIISVVQITETVIVSLPTLNIRFSILLKCP